MKEPLLSPKVLRQWTRVHPYQNLLWLALDLATAIAILTATLLFWLKSPAWGFPVAANIAVGIVAVILLGAVQHRIGLMGHEASHYMLHPNRRINDLLGEFLCFFPLFTSLSQYRSKHLGHHLHPNEPDLDPNLAGSRAQKLYARFPMPKTSFLYHYYLKFFWPPFVLSNLYDLLNVITLGSGISPIPSEEARGDRPPAKRRLYQHATVLGMGYLLVFIGAIHTGVYFNSVTLFAALTSTTLALGLLGWYFLPGDWFVRPGGKLAYSHKTSGLLRLTAYTLFFAVLGTFHLVTGIWAGGYFLLLWITALAYVFPYLMLLREIYQHANADQGPLTNSRVIHTDPFTRWALLAYGNDVHLVHHIYPNIPHYRLDEAHCRLMRENEDYGSLVEETYSTFFTNAEGKRTLLDALASEDSAYRSAEPGVKQHPESDLDNRPADEEPVAAPDIVRDAIRH